MIYAQLVAGFIYLLGGGDLLVRGGVALARRYEVPPILVALSVVALGTSLPELVVSIQASLTDHPSLILGNVVGSNIANVLLVAGAAAVLSPLVMDGPSMRGPAVGMLGISLAFAALCLDGGLSRNEGFLLLAGTTVVIGITLREGSRAKSLSNGGTPLEWALGVPTTLPIIALFIGSGAVALPLGADLLVDASVVIAERFAVPETVIGLTVVAIGTSLPEVTTSVVAALRGRTAMAVGTIVGSNTFNIVGIMGVTAAISAAPVPVSPRFLTLDLPVMLGVSAFLVAMTLARRSIGRNLGIALLGAYGVYLWVLYLSV